MLKQASVIAACAALCGAVLGHILTKYPPATEVVAEEPDQMAYGTVRNFSFRIDQNGAARFDRLRPNAEDHTWHVSCETPYEVLCMGFTRDLIIWLDENEQIHLSTSHDAAARITISSGAGTFDRPALFKAPLDTFTLGILRHEDAQIQLELDWRVLSRFETEGIDLVIDYLIFLIHNEPMDWRFEDRLALGTEEDINRFRNAQNNLERKDRPAWQVVPQAKPQSEFAIRAQVPPVGTLN